MIVFVAGLILEAIKPVVAIAVILSALVKATGTYFFVPHIMSIFFLFSLRTYASVHTICMDIVPPNLKKSKGHILSFFRKSHSVCIERLNLILILTVSPPYYFSTFIRTKR